MTVKELERFVCPITMLASWGKKLRGVILVGSTVGVHEFEAGALMTVANPGPRATVLRGQGALLRVYADCFSILTGAHDARVRVFVQRYPGRPTVLPVDGWDNAELCAITVHGPLELLSHRNVELTALAGLPLGRWTFLVCSRGRGARLRPRRPREEYLICAWPGDREGVETVKDEDGVDFSSVLGSSRPRIPHGAPDMTRARIKAGQPTVFGPPAPAPGGVDADSPADIHREALAQLCALVETGPPPSPTDAVVRSAAIAAHVGRDEDVAELWAIVEQRLAVLAPRALRALAGPAEEVQLRRAEKELGAMPAGLRATFACHNGLRPGVWARLLPEHDLLSVDQCIRVWRRHCALVPGRAVGTGEAGQEVGRFLPQFVPIAARDGYVLFVDTRPGLLHGCVTEYAREGADSGGPRWACVGHLLEDLAAALLGERGFDGMRPATEGGELTWLPADMP